MIGIGIVDPLVAVFSIVLEINGRTGSELVVPAFRTGWPKNQILHLAGPEIPRLNSQNKTQGVHAIALAGSIGTNDAGKRLEGTNLLEATVGFKVFEFEVGNRHFAGVLLLRGVVACLNVCCGSTRVIETRKQLWYSLINRQRQ